MVTFNFSFDPGTSVQQMTGFEIAGKVWSAYLKDNTTLNIHVGVSSSLPTGVIGGALPGIQSSQNYSNVRNRLQADRTTADDNLAFQNLQADPDKYTSLIDGFQVEGNKKMNVTRANAKALGLLNDSTNFLDGYILMSNLPSQTLTWNYDFTRTSPIQANQLDFLGTAIHELGHLLGFVSGVDQVGWLAKKVDYSANKIDDFYAKLSGKVENTTVLDLFRYTPQSVASGGANARWLDLSIGGNPYFSVDGGKTALAEFSTGEATNFGGDGQQASHWKNVSNSASLMAPMLRAGTRGNVTALDLRVFDIIGWNVASTGMGTPIDLSAMQTQVKQSLASRLGKTVAWLDANAAQAAQQLGQNREKDLDKMIDHSKVYGWGSEDDDPFWQRIQNLYAEQGLFEQLEPGAVGPAGSLAIDWGQPSVEMLVQAQQLGTKIAPREESVRAIAGLPPSSPWTAQPVQFNLPGSLGGTENEFRLTEWQSLSGAQGIRGFDSQGQSAKRPQDWSQTFGIERL